MATSAKLADRPGTWTRLKGRFGAAVRPPRRLKFTREGKYFTGMTLLVGFGAVNTGNNLLYLLLGMMLALIILSGVLSETVLQKLRVRRKLPEHIFAGHPALVEVRLANQKRRAASYSIQIVERIEGVPADQRPAVYFMGVDADTEEVGQYRYTFPHRGLWRIEGVEAATRFPFELFRKGRDLDNAPCEVLVYPAMADPPVLHAVASQLLGDLHQHKIGSGGDFHGLREMRYGDDARNIHWKTSARRGELIIREFEEEEARSLTICLDNRAPAWEREDSHRDQEYAVEVCAGLARDLLGKGYAVALATLDVHCPLGTGPGQLDRILSQLALVSFHQDKEAQQDKPTAEAMVVPEGAQCITVGTNASPPALQGGVLLQHIRAVDLRPRREDGKV